MEKVAIGVAVLLLLFFTQVTPDKVERELEKVLNQSLPAKRVDVELKGSPGFPTLEGKFKKLTVQIEGLSFVGGQLLEILPIKFTDKPEKEGKVKEVELILQDTLYEGLLISELKAYAQTVRFDLKGSLRERRLVLVSAASGNLSGFIPANSLGKYLSEYAERYGFEGTKVQLKHKFVEIEGHWKLTLGGINIAKIPFSAVAELFPVSNEIHWKLHEARIGDVLPVPTRLFQDYLQSLNPLIRFDLSPLQVRLTNLNVSKKGVSMSAEFSLSSQSAFVQSP